MTSKASKLQIIVLAVVCGVTFVSIQAMSNEKDPQDTLWAISQTLFGPSDIEKMPLGTASSPKRIKPGTPKISPSPAHSPDETPKPVPTTVAQLPLLLELDLPEPPDKWCSY